MTAFFDIDTQLDFVSPAGALYTPGAERVVPYVSKLNRYAAANGIPLISTLCSHEEDAAEFKVWRSHCVADTLGQRKIASTIVGGRQYFIRKNELDLFSNPELTPLLNELGVDECVVYGVLLEFCVKCAIMGLLKTGRRVTLMTDAVAHLDPAAGASVVEEFMAAGGRCSVHSAHALN